MLHNIKFAINFFKNPVQNASIIPSSKYLAKEMINGIDFSKIRNIIEFGPGTGTFTDCIIESAHKDSKIILIELEKDYIPILKKKYGKKVIIENESAHIFDELAEKHGMENIDLIVSGLGFVSLPPSVLNPLLRKLRHYESKGTIFRTFTYMPPIFKKTFKDFNIKKKGSTILNFPPAHVYGLN